MDKITITLRTPELINALEEYARDTQNAFGQGLTAEQAAIEILDYFLIKANKE